MTFKEIIQQVDDYKDNGFHERTKLSWLLALDGKVAADVMLMGIEEIRALPHTYPDAMKCEPLAGYPHDDIYVLWLEAKIDYANGEYNKYQNTMELFNEAYRNYRVWFASVYQPAQGRQVVGYQACCDFPVYYLTAYGLAVMKGYAGTLEEWLEYLKVKGDPGKTAYQYAVEGGYTGTEEAFADHMAGNGKTAYAYAVEGGYTGTLDEFRLKMAAEYAPLNHDHGETYAAYNHDHAEVYAPLNHNHGQTYAAYNHDHAEVYAPLNHSHEFCMTETVILYADEWGHDSKSQTLQSAVMQMQEPSAIIVAATPGADNFRVYTECGVQCAEEGQADLTFTCENIPDIDLTVNVIGFR